MSSPPTSPASTNTTRNRNRTPPLTPPLTPSETASNLPPPRPLNKENKLNPLLRNVKPPLSNTRLSTLIYVLVGMTTLLTLYFSYRTVQYKSEVGGWWSLLIGRGSSGSSSSSSSSSSGAGALGASSKTNTDTVESHILALAAALGVPTHELASAIAGAVRAYVPPASLSSIKAHETGDAVSVLLREPEATPTSVEGGEGGEHGAAWEAASTAAGVVGGVVEGVESFVGMDEP